MGEMDASLLGACIAEAITQNDCEALSVCLEVRKRKPNSIEEQATELLRQMIPVDAAECALVLLNYFEELRRERRGNKPSKGVSSLDTTAKSVQ